MCRIKAILRYICTILGVMDIASDRGRMWVCLSAPNMVASGVVSLMEGQSPAMVLSALFIVTALLTNVLSNNATAVLFTPIAIGIATRLGVPLEPFIICIIFAANCSFATPVGYQTNLLVLGPGRYRFIDYVRCGIPLILVLWIAFSLFAPFYYNI